MKKDGLSTSDIQNRLNNQKENTSFLWFKNEYLPNNRDKLIKDIEKYKK